MRKKQICGYMLFFLFFFLFFPLTAFAKESAGEESEENKLLENLEFKELDEALAKLFPEEKMNFKETAAAVIKGDMRASKNLLKRLIKDQLTYAFRVNKKNLVNLLLIALIAAVFTNFSSAFQNKQIAETSFYVLYLLLIALCLSSFKASADWVGEGVKNVLLFMRALGPVYFIAVAVAKGTSSSVVFYNLTLFLIYLVEVLILKFLLPIIHIYIMVKILNYLGEEDYLSRFAELLELLVAWTLKTLLACVAGINIIQGLLAPAIDTVKRSALTKGAEAIPGVGDALGGMAEVALGAAVLVKNGIGVTGAIVCIALCLAPFLQIAAITLLYKLAAAIIEPVSDKRLVGCIASVGEGGRLFMRVIFTVGLLFLLTIAVVSVTTGN